MEKDIINNTQKDKITEEILPQKKKVITSYDKNNEAYYSELNSGEPTLQQSHDYYELLKQQIKYYQELNSSLKDEIETVKQCKRFKEQEKNSINQKNDLNQELQKEKEPNLNLMNTLDGGFDKEIFWSESKNSNSDEQWLIVKKEMKRLEDENQFLKLSMEQLNDTFKNLKYPDEENNSYINAQENISLSLNKEESVNEFNIRNKLLLDNNRLKIYIEKIEQMQKLLIRYESQINSLNEEIKQKDEKMKEIIYKTRTPKKSDININEDSDMVNIDLNNENIKQNEKEILNQIEQINELKQECEKLKTENEKLNSELNKKNLIIENSPIKDTNFEEKEKMLNKDLDEYKNKLEQLLEKNKENENIIKDL